MSDSRPHLPSVDTTATATADPPTPGRRVVLAGVVALGAGGLLAACGGGDTEVAGSGATGGAPTGGAGSGSPDDAATTPGAPDAPSGSGDAEVLAAAADVPVGGGVVAGGVVVTQPEAGTFRGFSSTCTHQACQIASVRDGVIMCPCHGSRFSADDGSVLNGPASAPLPEVAVAMQGTDVVRA
jgi:Rieske Fe-S protein